MVANAVRECLWGSYNWVLLATLASCGALLLVPRFRRVYGVNAASTLLLYSYNFGNCLTIAIVFYLGDPRYLITQETFTLFAEFAGVVLTVHAVFALFRHRLLFIKRPCPRSARVRVTTSSRKGLPRIAPRLAKSICIVR